MVDTLGFSVRVEPETWWYFSCACLLSRFSCVWLLATPWSGARQAPLSMGFSRQEYWSGLPCPPPGDLPDPGLNPNLFNLVDSQAGFLPLAPPGMLIFFLGTSKLLSFTSKIFFFKLKMLHITFRNVAFLFKNSKIKEVVFLFYPVDWVLLLLRKCAPDSHYTHTPFVYHGYFSSI